ncbi:MAG: TSUP family transporter, partial [Humidesulfovibrio sp.]|nr:TSUP family transporter [Humidesulfovibrio sp.]
TSAAVGLPIALASSAGFIRGGMNAALPGLSGGYLGFIYLPAFIGIVCLSVLTAPLGAKLAHNLPVSKLKKIFACLLLIMGTKMLYGMF